MPRREPELTPSALPDWVRRAQADHTQAPHRADRMATMREAIPGR